MKKDEHTLIHLCQKKKAGILSETWDELAEMFLLDISGDKLRKRYDRILVKSWDAYEPELLKYCPTPHTDTYPNTYPARLADDEAFKYIPDSGEHKLQDKFYKYKVVGKGDGVNELTEISDMSLKGMTPQEILEKFEYSPESWELVKSSSELRGIQRATGTETSYYNNNITVKPRNAGVTEKGLLTMLADVLESPLFSDIKPRTKYEDVNEKCLVVNLADIHLNKFSSVEECGSSSDLSKSIKTVTDIVDRIVNTYQDRANMNILLNISHDYFNSDTVTNTTTAGTKQDNDKPWYIMYKQGMHLLHYVIDSLSELGNLTVFYIQSNHDNVSTYITMLGLQKYYQNHPRITFDIKMTPRRVFMFHDKMLCFIHDAPKSSKLTELFINDEPEKYGTSNQRFVFEGHKHKYNLAEESGFTIITLPSLGGVDAWTNKNYGRGSKPAANTCLLYENSQDYELRMWYVDE